MKKRALSLFLLIVMLISLVPAQAFAAEAIAGDSAVISDVAETAAEEMSFSEDEPVPDEEVEIIPMPEEEYEEVIKEPEAAVDENGENDSADGEGETSEEGEKTSVDGEDAEKDADVEETEEDAEPDEDEDKLFPGMPEGYTLSAEQIAGKQALNAYGVVDTLCEAVAGVDYADGEVFFLADTLEYAQTVAAAYGAELTEYASGVATIKLNGATVLDAVTAAADMNNNMPIVEANYIYKIEPVIETDGGNVSTYAYRDESGVSVKGSWKTWYESTDSPDTYMSSPGGWGYQYMHDVVNTYEAWGVTKGKGVTVAVIDSGVGYNDDLNGNVIIRECANTWDEYISDHGTHVAGIIAAEMGNGEGGAGIAPEAKIYSERVMNDYGLGWATDIVQGINNVINAKKGDLPSIKVMNMSLGSYGYSALEATAIQNAINTGITVVVAMGNEGTNIQCYPAAYNIPGLIAVQSSNKANTLSYFSNYGAWADVTAPGSDIMSTMSENGYDMMSGTSMAAPVVSGLCALYLSVYPDATPVQVEAAIKKATTNGIVDASKLFKNENKAPTIESEKTPDSSGALPYGSKLVITAADSSETIIYTVGGKTPSVVNGVVTGTVVPSDEFELEITSANGFEVGKRVTVKAAAVNGLGVLGKVETFIFKVGYAEADAIEFIDAPDELISGRKYTLTAKVLPAEANQKVLWKFENIEGCDNTKISENTGLLTTSAKDNGLITVTAYSPENEDDAYKTINIDIKPLDPTKKIVITSDNTSETVTALKTAELFINSTEKSESLQLYGVSYKASDIKKPVKDDNFTWTSSNTKVATVSDEGLVSAVGKGSATITCKAKDGTNVKSSLTVTVRTCADSLSISGLSAVAPGKSTRYTAVFNPKTIQYKTAFWWIEDTDGQGVTINPQTGKVTVPKDAESGKTFTVCVTSGLADCAKRTIKINSANAQVKIINNDSLFAGLYKEANGGVLKEATLFTTDAFNKEDKHFDTIQLGVKDSDSVCCDMIWTSSSPKVAAVDENGVVTALSVGKTTITCKASDAGGKSHSVRIVVINPASAVYAESTKEQSSVYSNATFVSGNTVRNIAKLGDAHGTPTIKTVTWDYTVEAYASGYAPVDCTRIAKDYKLFTINTSTGQLKSSKTAYSTLVSESQCEGFQFFVVVTAKTTDGTNLTGSVPYTLLENPMSALLVEYNKNYYTNLKYPVVLLKDEGAAVLPVTSEKIDGTFEATYNWTVKTSNPNVAGAQLTQSKNEAGALIPAVLIVAGRKTGSATITLTAADGSNKTVKITVKVVNRPNIEKLSVKLDKNEVGKEYTLSKDETVTFTAAPYPSTSTAYEVTWSVEKGKEGILELNTSDDTRECSVHIVGDGNTDVKLTANCCGVTKTITIHCVD